jgi:choline dehydrogenase-like flavoprotein
VLPGSTYVNPQITIMALAARSAQRLAAEAS